MDELPKADGLRRLKYTGGILLETFRLQGWVCGKWRLQGWRTWSGRRLKRGEFRASMRFTQRKAWPRHPPTRPPALKHRQHFPGLWDDGWGIILLFAPKKHGAESLRQHISLAVIFTVIAPPLKSTEPHFFLAWVLSCLVGIIWLIASIKEKLCRKLDPLC